MHYSRVNMRCCYTLFRLDDECFLHAQLFLRLDFECIFSFSEKDFFLFCSVVWVVPSCWMPCLPLDTHEHHLFLYRLFSLSEPFLTRSHSSVEICRRKSVAQGFRLSPCFSSLCVWLARPVFPLFEIKQTNKENFTFLLFLVLLSSLCQEELLGDSWRSRKGTHTAKWFELDKQKKAENHIAI